MDRGPLPNPVGYVFAVSSSWHAGYRTFYIASCTLQERRAETEACDVIQNHSHAGQGPKFSLKQQTFIEVSENI